jgi:hypothetical protein
VTPDAQTIPDLIDGLSCSKAEGDLLRRHVAAFDAVHQLDLATNDDLRKQISELRSKLRHSIQARETRSEHL